MNPIETIPEEYLPAVVTAFMCVIENHSRLAIQLPKNPRGLPDKAFMDEDGWYCEAFDLLATFGLVSSKSKG